MDLESLASAQAQSAISIAIQLIFPNLAIGLAAFLAVLEGLWMATRLDAFRGLYLVWSKVFAVTFGLGSLSILMVRAQLDWDVGLVRSILAMGAMIVLTAFAVGAPRRLGTPGHFAATLAVALGTVAATAWLVAVAARSSHPGAAYDLRLAYALLSAYLVTALGIGAACAWRLLKSPDETPSALGLRMAVGTVAITSPLLFLTVSLTPDLGLAGLDGWSLHALSILGLALAAAALFTGWFGLRPSGLERSRAFLHAAIGMGALGLTALMTGWIAGRMVATPFWGAPASLSLWSPGLSLSTALLFGAGTIWTLRIIADGPRHGPGDGT